MAPLWEGHGALISGWRSAPLAAGKMVHSRSLTKGMMGCTSASSVRKLYTSTCTNIFPYSSDTQSQQQSGKTGVSPLIVTCLNRHQSDTENVPSFVKSSHMMLPSEIQCATLLHHRALGCNNQLDGTHACAQNVVVLPHSDGASRNRNIRGR